MYSLRSYVNQSQTSEGGIKNGQKKSDVFHGMIFADIKFVIRIGNIWFTVMGTQKQIFSDSDIKFDINKNHLDKALTDLGINGSRH